MSASVPGDSAQGEKNWRVSWFGVIRKPQTSQNILTNHQIIIISPSNIFLFSDILYSIKPNKMKPGHLYRSPAAGSRAASPGCCWSWNCLCAEPQWCSCGSQWWCKRRWVAQRLQGNSSPPGCSAERWSPACHWWCRCCRPPEWWRSVPGPPSPWEKKKNKKKRRRRIYFCSRCIFQESLNLFITRIRQNDTILRWCFHIFMKTWHQTLTTHSDHTVN